MCWGGWKIDAICIPHPLIGGAREESSRDSCDAGNKGIINEGHDVANWLGS